MNRDILKLTAIFTGVAVITGCTALGHSEGYSRYGDYRAPAPVTHYLRPAPYQPYYFGAQPTYHHSGQHIVVETARTRFQPIPRHVSQQVSQHVYRAAPMAPRPVKLANNITRENGVMVHRPATSRQDSNIRIMRPAPPQNMHRIAPAPIRTSPEPVAIVPEYKPQETYIFEDTARSSEVSLPKQPEFIQPEFIQPEPNPVQIPSPMPEPPQAAAPEVEPEFEYEAKSSALSGVDISYVRMGGGSNIADWEACETQTGGYVEWTQNGYAVDPAFDNCMRTKGYKPESEAEESLAGAN